MEIWLIKSSQGTHSLPPDQAMILLTCFFFRFIILEEKRDDTENCEMCYEAMFFRIPDGNNETCAQSESLVNSLMSENPYVFIATADPRPAHRLGRFQKIVRSL